MTKSIWFGSLALAASLFLAACGDESPYSKAEDDLDDMEYEANREYENQKNEKDNYETMSEEEKCYYGENSHPDSWCCSYYGYRCSYVSSSSSYRSSSSSYRASSSSKKKETLSDYDYLTSSKTMNFTLTYYKQTVCSMEGKGSKACSYDDGDPKISFKLIFVKFTGDSTTYSTSDKLGKKWFYYENTGEWEGRKTFTVSVPAYTELIRVCPTVLDDDLMSDDSMSSNYCYYFSGVGSLGDQEIVYQSDFQNTNCKLKWEWYLY